MTREPEVVAALEHRLHLLLKQEFGFELHRDYENDTNLYESLIDSFGFVKLLTLLETVAASLGVEVDAEYLLSEETLSVSDIVRYLRRDEP